MCETILKVKLNKGFTEYCWGMFKLRGFKVIEWESPFPTLTSS